MPTDTAGAARRILVVGDDSALLELLREWLADGSCIVIEERLAHAADQFDLAIVDVPFPRQGGHEVIARVTERYPGLPVVVLSSGFFGDVDCQGGVARTLGVQSVLPKPVSRERLANAVAQLAGQMALRNSALRR